MVEHDLKCSEQYWDKVASGEKRFEVRRDDRGFQRGDILLLRKTSADRPTTYITPRGDSSWPAEAYTIRMRVDWILTGGQLGVEPGYVVMSISPVGD